MFKTGKYLNNRKVAEAVSRLLSNSVDPLFYLSSFQTLSRETRYLVTDTGFFRGVSFSGKPGPSLDILRRQSIITIYQP